MARELSDLQVLTQDVTNPRPDRRKREEDFEAVPVWVAGTVLQVSETELGTRIYLEWSPSLRKLSGEILKREQIEAILPFLRPATAEDALRTMFEDAPGWAANALRGKVALISAIV